jgi:hypothetical protein
VPDCLGFPSLPVLDQSFPSDESALFGIVPAKFNHQHVNNNLIETSWSDTDTTFAGVMGLAPCFRTFKLSARSSTDPLRNVTDCTCFSPSMRPHLNCKNKFAVMGMNHGRNAVAHIFVFVVWHFGSEEFFELVGQWINLCIEAQAMLQEK